MSADYEEDDDLKREVIDQMMGELDDVTAGSLKRDPEKKAVGGVEIRIAVCPKPDMAEDREEGEAEVDAAEEDAEDEEPESSDYISQLLKKFG